MKIANILQAKAQMFPKKTAFIFKDQTITFKQLADTVFRLADSLLRHPDLKIRSIDKVAVCLPNSMEYVYSYLGIWCCGATVVPLDYGLTEEEVAACITHSDARVLIIKPNADFDLKSLQKRCKQIQRIIVCQEKQPRYLWFDDLVEKGSNDLPEVEIRDKDPAIIFYTSGTTGKMKGVLVNYLQLGVPSQAMEYFVSLSEKDVTVCALPFSHLGGLIYIQNCISFAMTVVLLERFVPVEFLRCIQDFKVSCFWIVPSMYYALLSLKEFEKYDLSSLRWMVTFGASNSPEALRRFHQYAPQAHLLNGWGLTETNAPTTVLPMGSSKIESVGRPVPFAQVRVINEWGRPVRPGEVGEIIVKGWIVTDGYYKDPAATKDAIRKSWFFTGDLGKFDEEGDLYIVGRKKEMIKVAGEIVYEPEVEAAIHQHEAVAEVAVVGVPDQLRGEVPKAFVVLKAGIQGNENELRQFCRKRLAHFKIPHYFMFVPSLPKNRTGKVDKEQLRGM